MKETNPFLKGFGLTCGVVAAISVIALAVICACSILYVLADPTSQRVFENVTQDLKTPARDRLPTRTPGPTPTPIMIKFDGHGDDVVFFTTQADGLTQFSFNHLGESNFSVKLLDADGNVVDLLVNEIGDYQGQKATRLNRGQYGLEITADGNWAAVVAPPQ